MNRSTASPSPVHATMPQPTTRRPRPSGGKRRSRCSLIGIDRGSTGGAPTLDTLSSVPVAAKLAPMGSERGVAAVTGASSGIGLATARVLASLGFEVVAGARRMDRLEPLAEELGGRACRLDVTDRASVEA